MAESLSTSSEQSSKRFEYFAFISYQHGDSNWARWLQRSIECYRLPKIIRKQAPHLPKHIHPVFCDQTDINAGPLEKTLRSELEDSRYLIVVCSPRSVDSEWVNKEAQHFVDRPDYQSGAERERRFFAELNKQVLVVANSRLVSDGIRKHFDWPAEQLRVCYPGFRAVTFSSERRAALRTEARGALGISDDTPLVGFVTSGDFHKRGIDVFIDTATAMLEQRPDLRFLVAGSRMLPSWLQQHELLKADCLMHRPRGARPERWMSALDVFLYPAHFEEFGMVILEACALGVPIVTSRRVGAVECLPEEYAPYVCDAPVAEEFCELGLRLLEDEAARETLRGAGITAAEKYSDRRYAEDSVSIVSSKLESAAKV